jgi:hypothetical protein
VKHGDEAAKRGLSNLKKPAALKAGASRNVNLDLGIMNHIEVEAR